MLDSIHKTLPCSSLSILILCECFSQITFYQLALNLPQVGANSAFSLGHNLVKHDIELLRTKSANGPFVFVLQSQSDDLRWWGAFWGWVFLCDNCAPQKSLRAVMRDCIVSWLTEGAWNNFLQQSGGVSCEYYYKSDWTRALQRLPAVRREASNTG